MEPGLRQGKLIKWKDERGFGFIQPTDESLEVFLHISELKDSTRRPQVGDIICYYTVTENGKTRACNAFILGARIKKNSSSTSNNISKYPFPILELLLLSSLPLIGSIHFTWITANPIPLILYPLMSFLTFALYANDKSRAKRGDWRISEQMLHLCELAGGWLGGFVAQRKLRHKNIKRSYQVVFWIIVTLHIAFWVDWLFLSGTIMKIFLRSNFKN
ncbi:cold shock and DUF1294 domain-containing protein [Crocosphaera sp. XPORK-15E]|uniref:cold shock and DUF1294 domain-containing protein n=1 Tax=Crocosphaera sp. XPORK-15E TaxID=3110247 RepID=UPI002B207F50|nr:cold shock and DUF1294 domain-containing protein [Crocosphaera sp. XPORK-15E]MEA5536078.1 cold shock and DUF1294 domain-containing protein [Crocosphaera sp. XPORK-15E]